jgi:hypothetical protein
MRLPAPDITCPGINPAFLVKFDGHRIRHKALRFGFFGRIESNGVIVDTSILNLVITLDERR